VNRIDTSLGGADRRFPETTGGFLRDLRAGGEARRAAFETMCRRYWKPIYTFVRIARTRSNEDAKDLTQAFLLWLFEGDALQRYMEERGRFRTYLKVVLARFLKDHVEAMRALKRGGGVRLLPLDEIASADEVIADPRSPDPEHAFDRAWAIAVAQAAVERVRGRTSAQHFRVYELYDLRPVAEKPTYADVAAAVGISESDVRNHLHSVRQEIAAEIRSELARTVDDPRELEEEWNALFGS